MSFMSYPPPPTKPLLGYVFFSSLVRDFKLDAKTNMVGGEVGKVAFFHLKTLKLKFRKYIFN